MWIFKETNQYCDFHINSLAFDFLFNSATTSFPTCIQNKMKEVDCSYLSRYKHVNKLYLKKGNS